MRKLVSDEIKPIMTLIREQNRADVKNGKAEMISDEQVRNFASKQMLVGRTIHDDIIEYIARHPQKSEQWIKVFEEIARDIDQQDMQKE